MKKKKIVILTVVLSVILLINCGGSTTTDVTTDTTISNTVKTTGTLSVSTLTSSAGGNYAPRNIVAIWIESGSGTYVKTLLVYANTYKQYLTNWRSNSGYNTTDAITGATVNSHNTRVCSWNGTDKSGNIVGDERIKYVWN